MREQLLDRMIRIYGFEHEIVIEFARMCEEWLPTENNDKALETLVKCHEENPVGFDDDEDFQKKSVDKLQKAYYNKYIIKNKRGKQNENSDYRIRSD